MHNRNKGKSVGLRRKVRWRMERGWWKGDEEEDRDEDEERYVESGAERRAWHENILNISSLPRSASYLSISV